MPENYIMLSTNEFKNMKLKIKTGMRKEERNLHQRQL